MIWGGHDHGGHGQRPTSEGEKEKEVRKILAKYHDDEEDGGDVILAPKK
jgi:hypothetical protein